MRKAILLGVLATVLGFTVAAVAYAADYRDAGGPEVNPTVAGAGVSNQCVGGQKLDGVGGDLVDGTYPFYFDGFLGSITIDVRDTAAGKVFDFYTSDITFDVVTSILVKGGPQANGSAWYNYAGGGFADVGADDGLHSLQNPNNGKWYGLSHICVYTDKL
jgi:hypothetical protein